MCDGIGDTGDKYDNKFEMAKCKCYTRFFKGWRGLFLPIYPPLPDNLRLFLPVQTNHTLNLCQKMHVNYYLSVYISWLVNGLGNNDILCIFMQLYIILCIIIHFIRWVIGIFYWKYNISLWYHLSFINIYLSFINKSKHIIL